MKFLIITFIILNLLVASQCAVSLMALDALPDHPDECYNKNQTVFYKKGEIIDNEESTSCQRKVCSGKFKDGKVLIETYTCGVAVFDNDHNYCKKTGPYPDCCQYVKCKDE